MKKEEVNALAGLLLMQKAAYQEMLELGERQKANLQDINKVLEIMAEKKGIVERVERHNKKTKALLERFKEMKRQMDASDVQRIESVILEVEGLLKRIIEIEDECAASVKQRSQDVSTEMGQVVKGKEVIKQYVGGHRYSSRFFDRSG